jgi:hypothetical protein
MCVRCGTGRIAWCTDPYRHGESAEPVSPGDPPVVTEATRSPVDMPSYEAGYRDGTSSLIADIGYQFTGEPGTAQTLGEVLEWLRRLTGDPNLAWPEDPVDWRDMFARYARSVQEQEGYYLLHEFGWTPGEWGAITALPGMERPV